MRNLKLFAGTVLIAVTLLFTSSNLSYSEEQISNTEIVPIDSIMGIEKTTLTMNVPSDNSLPWAFVEGKISKPVPDHPVIIQIFDNDDQIQGNNIGATHFAQTGVNEDGTYEYKFRIFDISDNKRTDIFHGEYTIKIFKVVYLSNDLTSA